MYTHNADESQNNYSKKPDKKRVHIIYKNLKHANKSTVTRDKWYRGEEFRGESPERRITKGPKKTFGGDPYIHPPIVAVV